MLAIYKPPREHEMVLEPGISLLGLATDQTRVRLSSGTVAPVGAAHKHDRFARLPHPEWRPATDEEMAVLTTPGELAGLFSFVAVVKVCDDIIRRLRETAERIKVTGVPPADARPPSEIEPEFAECIGTLASTFTSATEDVRCLGFARNRPRLATVTEDKSRGSQLGLHVDSWFRLPLRERVNAPNRLCINLGLQPRRFMFVNLSLMRIARVWSSTSEKRSSEILTATDLGRRFMALHPSYPIVSTEIGPGEAYIAPTEDIIHDGNTEGLNPGVEDIVFTLLGHFLPARSIAGT